MFYAMLRAYDTFAAAAVCGEERDALLRHITR